jgi:hypothetical protein
MYLARSIEAGQVQLVGTEIDADVLDALRHELQGERVFDLFFRKSTFIADVQWAGVTVRGAASFVESTFASGADFSTTTFVSGADFDGAQFPLGASFAKCHFEGGAKFVGTTWGTKLPESNRHPARLHEKPPADFRHATFSSPADFSQAQFPLGASFNWVDFKAGATFALTTWGTERSESEWRQAIFDNTPPAGFYETRIAGDVDFDFAKFWVKPEFRKTVFGASARFYQVKAFRQLTWQFDQVTFAGPVTLDIALPAEADEIALDILHKGNELDVMLLLDGAGRRHPFGSASAEHLLADAALLTAEERAAGFGGVVLYRMTVAGPTTFALGANGTGTRVSYGVVERATTWIGSGANDAIWPRFGGFVDTLITAPVIFANVSFEAARFEGTTGLDQLRTTGPVRWPTRGHLVKRRAIAAEWDLDPSAERAASAREFVYRQLRVGLEESKAAPEAADFYNGELEARRHAAGDPLDRILIPVYRWVGGYGVRPGPPLFWLLIVVLGTGLFFQIDHALVRPPSATAVEVTRTPRQPPGETTVVEERTTPMDSGQGKHSVDGYNLERYGDALAFVSKNSISLFSAPTTGLTALGTLIVIIERFAAVTLIGLTVFAVRSRVQR